MTVDVLVALFCRLGVSFFLRGTPRMKLLFAGRVVACLVVCCPVPSTGQASPIQLWPGGVPGAATGSASSAVRITPEGEHVLSHVAEPSITPYLPSSSTATCAAVVVIPGGGHSEIWIDHEGYAVAKWLGEHGVAAFVLQYRLAREKGSTYTVEATELADAAGHLYGAEPQQGMGHRPATNRRYGLLRRRRAR